MNLSVPAHISLEFQIGQLERPDVAPHLVKTSPLVEGIFLQIVVVFFAFLGQKSLMDVVFIKELPTGLGVKGRIECTPSCYGFG